MFKKFFLNKSINIIKDNFPDYNNDKIDEIKYGLEATYLSLTKTIVILFVTFLLGIFKESILVLLLFNGVRLTGFGIHAKESWMCWISSSIVFIGIPILCIYAKIPMIIHYITIAFSMLCFLLYAPSDTVKRPLVKKEKRIKFKVFTLIIAFIYLLVFINISDIFLKNVITSVMLLEAILIHPLTYKVFKLPYKNYERYVFSK